MLLYPLAVLLLIVLFPSRLDIVAAAWGILAAGDGMASIAGTHLGGARIPWNRDKTVAGSVALWLCGGAAGGVPGVVVPAGGRAAAVVCGSRSAHRSPPPPSRRWWRPSRSGWTTTSPCRYRRRRALGRLAHARGPGLVGLSATPPPALPAGAAVNLVVAFAGHRARTVSTSGAIVGAASAS